MNREPLNLFDYEARAREIVPRTAWDELAGGAGREAAAGRVRPAFDSILLRPRMLRGVAGRQTSTTVLGRRIDLPVMAAAPAPHPGARPGDGLATARAAAAAGTVMVLGHGSQAGVDDIAGEAAAPCWFRLRVHADRGIVAERVRRAEAAGCAAMVLSASAPAVRAAEARTRNGRGRGPGPADIDPSVTWSILDWLRSATSLPIVVEGIASPRDAGLAVENGAAGIIVSHRAAPLCDGAIAAVEALPGVVDAVGGRCEVYLQGGVRRGIDVLKALALGARACLVGGPLFCALAVGGESGARRIFEILKDELDFAMAMCGVRTIDDIDRDLVTRPEWGAF